MESGLQEAIETREEGERPFVVERDQLKTRWIVLEAPIEENIVAKERRGEERFYLFRFFFRKFSEEENKKFG